MCGEFDRRWADDITVMLLLVTTGDRIGARVLFSYWSQLFNLCPAGSAANAARALFAFGQDSFYASQWDLIDVWCPKGQPCQLRFPN